MLTINSMSLLGNQGKGLPYLKTFGEVYQPPVNPNK